MCCCFPFFLCCFLFFLVFFVILFDFVTLLCFHQIHCLCIHLHPFPCLTLGRTLATTNMGDTSSNAPPQLLPGMISAGMDVPAARDTLLRCVVWTQVEIRNAIKQFQVGLTCGTRSTLLKRLQTGLIRLLADNDKAESINQLKLGPFSYNMQGTTATKCPDCPDA